MNSDELHSRMIQGLTYVSPPNWKMQYKTTKKACIYAFRSVIQSLSLAKSIQISLPSI